jgi:predicted dehydrogenase
MAEFETGAVGFVDTCFNIPDRASPNRLELYGSKGSILAEGTISQGQAGTMLARVEQQNGYQAAQTRRMTDGLAVEAPTVNLYKAQIEDVNSAIREDRQPLCDGEAGLWSQKVLAACYESSRISRTVEVA